LAPVRRTLVLLLLLVLAAMSLAACGKGSLTSTVVQREGAATSSSSTATAPPATTTGTTPVPGTTQPPSTTPSTPTTPTTPSAPAQTPAREHAAAFARAVNLTSDDVPGFTPSEKHTSSSGREKRLEHAMLQCAGVAAKTKAVLEESSKDFELKRQILDFSVSSEVSVQASDAQALQGLNAIRNPHVRSCFSHYLSLIFKGEQVKGATAGPVKIQAGTPPAPGTAGAFGWRVTATFTVHGVKLPIYLDFLGFVDGPAEVTLLSSGLLRPFPASVQQHLFTLLLSRAKAHKL
jgi:hypothetical protein